VKAAKELAMITNPFGKENTMSLILQGVAIPDSKLAHGNH
jgi:hypothetical protein